MLFMTFKAAGTRFALPARDVDEITPLVELSPLPGSPAYVAGLMNHRGRGLPVADLTMLLAGRGSRPWASTRILVAEAGRGLTLGLMAERALKTMDLDPDGFAAPGAPAAPYVKSLALAGDELVQVLDVSRLLPAELIDSLKAASEAALKVPPEAA
jgi:chemotaxis signal transduction protein